jgi:hypothetical protein
VRSDGAVYSPLASLVSVRVTPVSGEVIVTLAPGSAPPGRVGHLAQQRSADGLGRKMAR